MKQVLIFITLAVAGCLIAGLYGIVHDQLTYSISPEYYTKFKFYQFGLLDESAQATSPSPRTLVSIVGFFATWWMGIPIATSIGLFSFHSDAKFMIDVAMKAFLVTMAVAFVTGLYGLGEGYAYLAHQPKENFKNWFIPGNLVDFKNFIAVGSMHNYSYFGGMIGIFEAIAYIAGRRVLRARQNK